MLLRRSFLAAISALPFFRRRLADPIQVPLSHPEWPEVANEGSELQGAWCELLSEEGEVLARADAAGLLRDGEACFYFPIFSHEDPVSQMRISIPSTDQPPQLRPTPFGPVISNGGDISVSVPFCSTRRAEALAKRATIGSSGGVGSFAPFS